DAALRDAHPADAGGRARRSHGFLQPEPRHRRDARAAAGGRRGVGAQGATLQYPRLRGDVARVRGLGAGEHPACGTHTRRRLGCSAVRDARLLVGLLLALLIAATPAKAANTENLITSVKLIK